ncbi:hypothetical protein GCM10025877_02400 [Agromyces mangrovi Wang et al. 2018]|nr:hypothetical protein GCM10025877_02400 [Agromyces mangrovi]
MHRLRGVELDDLDDVDELVELLRHLLEREILHVDHDGDAAEPLDLRVADGERLDIEAAAGEEARDAGEQAGLVLDEEESTCDIS